MTVGYASGVIPRIPLNLVLLKGCRTWASSSSTSPPTPRTNWPATTVSSGTCWRQAPLSPHIGATFDLAEASAALQLVADGRAVGKVVLDVTAGALRN